VNRGQNRTLQSWNVSATCLKRENHVIGQPKNKRMQEAASLLREGQAHQDTEGYDWLAGCYA